MPDLANLPPPKPWGTVARQRHKGEHPSAAELRAALRSGPIPVGLLEYVCSRIDERIPGRGRGRPVTPAEKRLSPHLRLQWLVNWQQARYKLQNKRAPARLAKEKIAKDEGMSVHTLRDKLRELGKAPELARSVPDVATFLQILSDPEPDPAVEVYRAERRKRGVQIPN
jgi:hypothetical protein